MTNFTTNQIWENLRGELLADLPEDLHENVVAIAERAGELVIRIGIGEAAGDSTRVARDMLRVVWADLQAVASMEVVRSVRNSIETVVMTALRTGLALLA